VATARASWQTRLGRGTAATVPMPVSRCPGRRSAAEQDGEISQRGLYNHTSSVTRRHPLYTEEKAHDLTTEAGQVSDRKRARLDRAGRLRVLR